MGYDRQDIFESTYGMGEVELAEKREILKKACEGNRDRPYFGIGQFRYAESLYSAGDFGRQETEMVPTGLILAGSTLRHWGDVEEFRDARGLARLWQVYESMSKKGFDMNEPLYLYELGGAYMINGGQRRTMAAMALRIDRVPARVIRQYPTVMNLPNEHLWEMFMSRKKQGYWEGSETFSVDGEGRYSGGSAQVMRSEGVWVFAEQMERVKRAYRIAGASGQAEWWG